MITKKIYNRIEGMSFKNEGLDSTTVFTLFRHARLRFMTLVAFYAWLVVGTGYYALTISASGPKRYFLDKYVFGLLSTINYTMIV